MKKPLALKSIFTVLLLSIFLISCSTDDNNHYIDREEIAGFMAINTVTDQEGIGVSLSGVRVGQPLAYRAYTGGYLNIFPGKRSTNSFSPYSGNTLSSIDFDYEKGKYYSLFITGREDAYENIVVEDPLNDLDVQDSIAYVRYIHAIPMENTSKITIEGATELLLDESAAYREVSDFIPLKAQEINVKIEIEDLADFERKIELEDRKIYTILIVGDLDSDKEWSEPQIRYIENGKLIKEQEDDQAISLQ